MWPTWPDNGARIMKLESSPSDDRMVITMTMAEAKAHTVIADGQLQLNIPVHPDFVICWSEDIVDMWERMHSIDENGYSS
jgi:hypothetical protein